MMDMNSHSKIWINVLNKIIGNSNIGIKPEQAYTHVGLCVPVNVCVYL